MSGTYQRFLSKFTECYGRDKIVSAIGYYYGKDAASAIYDAMNDFIGMNLNDTNEAYYDDYENYDDYEYEVTVAVSNDVVY